MDSSGWLWKAKSPWAHYYVNGQSLCNTSAYFEDDLEDFDDRNPSNCRDCAKKVKGYRKQHNKKLLSKGPLKVSIKELSEPINTKE